MIKFRASSSGNCTREIVQAQLQPTDDPYDPFLMGGHGLQTTVIGFLEANGVKVVTSKFEDEFEGRYVAGDKWKLVGHVDGLVFGGKLSVLEVKAIQDKNFKKLQEINDWRAQYKYYQPQVQSYMGFTSYQSPDKQHTLLGPCEQAHMVFYNRNTGEDLSPFEIDHPLHTQRSDLIELRDPKQHTAIINKMERAYEYVQKGELPSDCDAEGYCFFCARFSNPVSSGKTSYLSGDEGHPLLDSVLLYRALKKTKKKTEKQMEKIAEEVVALMDEMDVETIKFKFKDKRGIILKRWEFAHGNNS